MECKREIYVNGLKFRIHPVFDQYAASRCGKIVNIEREAILLGNPSSSNYLLCRVWAKNAKNQKSVYVHRFVYECYHGIIPYGLVIDHMNNDMNDDKIDNRLCNLQLVTQQENSLKGAKNNVKRSPPRAVVAINLTTRERFYFPSITRTGKELGIVPPSIQKVCEKICQSARSNYDDYWYQFEYLD